MFSKSFVSCGRNLYSRLYTEANRAPASRLYSTSTTSEKNIYDTRKISKDLPKQDVNLPFEGLPDIPNGVFRETCGEVLGPHAGKCCYYRNPEYFSFHDMSFFDFTLYLNKRRKPQPKSGRKPL